MQELFTIHFSQGSTAVALCPKADSELATTLQSLGLAGARPAIVLVGGASQLQQYHMKRLRSLFVKVLAPLAEALSAIVIDGGTNTGIMRMMGATRHKTHSTFPLLGIAPVGVTTLPGERPCSQEAAPLEPHHTHFMLVPGNRWGDDSPWIAKAASVLAGGSPTVTVLMNGGKITWKDACESVEAGRPIIAAAGSGRVADVLVSALNGNVTDKRAKRILASGLLQAVSLENDDGLAAAVQSILSCGQTERPLSPVHQSARI